MIPTPAAELAEMAAECIAIERYSAFKPESAARKVTRGLLCDHARELGFPETEIEAAVDAALAGR